MRINLTNVFGSGYSFLSNTGWSCWSVKLFKSNKDENRASNISELLQLPRNILTFQLVTAQSERVSHRNAPWSSISNATAQGIFNYWDIS